MNIFMQIAEPAIPGSGTTKQNRNQFDVLTLSFSAVEATTHSKTTLSGVTVTVDEFNGPLLLNSIQHGTSHKVTFTFYVTQQQDAVYQTIVLTGAFLSLFQVTANAGATRPVLELTFGYEAIEYVLGHP